MNALMFQAPMIRALGSGKKTQTRRVPKEILVRLPARVTADRPFRGVIEPGVHAAYIGTHGAVAVQIPGERAGEFIGVKPGEFHFLPKSLGVDAVRSETCLVSETRLATSSETLTYWLVTPPKGKRLYVREALKLDHAYDPPIPVYAADGDRCPYVDTWPWKRPWLSPIHMPQGCHRYELADISIRVERLQSITDDAARAEGIAELPLQEGADGAWWTGDVTAGPDLHARSPREAFRKLWCRIHSAASWDANPWLYAYSFTVHHREDL